MRMFVLGNLKMDLKLKKKLYPEDLVGVGNLTVSQDEVDWRPCVGILRQQKLHSC